MIPVTISGECEKLTQPVRLPSPEVTGKDLGVVAAENRAAARTANQRLAGASGCQADQRQRFGK